MSARAIEPSGATRGKRGLNRLLARMKSVLKTDLRPRAPVLSTSEVANGTTAAPPEAATTGQTAPASDGALASPNWDDPTRPLSPDSNPDTDQSYAQELAGQYTVDAESVGWKKAPLGDRMQKKIRMRVHHSCHKCNTLYGATMICASCDHVRCMMCPRYPPKKSSMSDNGKSAEEGEDAIVAGATPENSLLGKDKYPFTKPSKTGRQHLVRKKVTQRVRRTCHMCETVFQPDKMTCTKCNHIRCTYCPRQPPHVNKYPFGYPGDVTPPSESSTSRPPRPILRYRCHNCSAIFEVGEASCGSCKHKKCVDCKRVRPKKVKPQSDPDLVKKVDTRLAAMGLGQSYSSTEPEPS